MVRPPAVDSRGDSFIEEHGYDEYGLWHLGVDDEAKPDTKARYRFPYRDFREGPPLRAAAAESRAGPRRYYEIERAVAHLHSMVEGMHAAARTRR